MVNWQSDNPQATYACNPELLKFLREKLGLTQAELAKSAGYSDRLIRKAESGHSISSETVEVLAEALTTEQQKIYPEDLISHPAELAKQYIAAVYIHQADVVSKVRHFLDEDVVFKINGDPQTIPFAGIHCGIDTLDRVFRELFFTCLEVPRGHDHSPHYQYISQGTEVVVWGESWIHPIGRPLEKPMPISNLMKFRRGKMIYMEDNFDTEYGAKVLTCPLSTLPKK